MNRRGFTLIELLVTVVITGLLASIAVPRIRTSKEKSYRATMTWDLRNLAQSQESYFALHNAYYNGAIPDPSFPFAASNEVGISFSGVATGWSATATHSGSSVTCAIFYGTAAPLAPATAEGRIACAESS